MALATATRFVVSVDPALAETVVSTALSRSDAIASEAGEAHRRRADVLYSIADPADRDAAFGALAIREFEGLGLAGPLLRALRERPVLADRVRLVLVGVARGGSDEGVTCDRGGERLGFRVAAGRFDEPAGLLAWARHATGHAEDTLDPAFGFEPGWEDPAGASLAAAARGRLHCLWDLSVDARLAEAGRLVAAAARRRHRALVAADLVDVEPGAIDAVVDHLWQRRPTFPDLLSWAERPADLIRLAAPGVTDMPRLDRCPLCSFPSDDIARPDARLAALVALEYPAWTPDLGLCGRCSDRYRFRERLGGRP